VTLSVAVVALAGSLASAQVLWDNGPLVTSTGDGPGGGDRSTLQNSSLGEFFLGFGHQLSANNRVADDFVVSGNWTIDTICFFAYQTGASAPSMTGYNVNIWDGVPNAVGSSIVGSSSSLLSTGFTNIYRDTETAPNATNRRIQLTEIDFGGLALAAGTYWLDWQANGSVASGPWQPPVTRLGETNSPGANAIQQIGGVWAALQDGGSLTPDDLPFVIKGVPTPGSMAVLGFAGLAASRRRR
jgi:hypothetical protein